MKRDFKSKRCIVTGAGSGIGRALALDIVGRGALVALCDINEEGLAETRALIGEDDTRHRYDKLDVSDRDAVNRYAENLTQSWGAVDVLINNAGLSRVGSFLNTPADSYDRVMDVNFRGLVDMCRAFAPQLVKNKGAIVNVSSMFGLLSYFGQSHYSASKFAVRGFTESLCFEMAPLGVLVTCVHPGGVATNIAQSWEVDALPPGVKSKEVMTQGFDRIAATSPQSAAATILNGIEKNKSRILIGKDAHFFSRLQRLFPVGYRKMVRRHLG